MELALAIVTPDAVAHVAEILEMLGAASVPVKQQFRLALSAKQADALLPTVVEMPGKQEDDDAESVQQPDAKGGKGGKGGKADKAGKAAKGGSKRGGAPAAAAEPEPADATVDPAEQEARRRELAEKYRADLLTHLASGPVTALVMRGVGACKALRQVAGGRFGPDPEGLTYAMLRWQPMCCAAALSLPSSHPVYASASASTPCSWRCTAAHPQRRLHGN